MPVHERMEWSSKVSIFRNNIILKQLALAIGIPFGLLVFFLLFTGIRTGSTEQYYALGLIAATFLLAFLIVRWVFGSTYDLHFVLDEKGILCRNEAKQAGQIRKLSVVTTILGHFSGNATVAGAGILAGTGSSRFLRWNQVRKIRCYPQNNVVMVKGLPTETIAVFCNDANYREVEAFISSRCPRQFD